MLRGLYTATAGMISQQRKHDTITNNIANMNTPGFKQSRAVSRSFPEMLIGLMEGKPGMEVANTGKLNTGVLAEEALTINVQGILRETNNPFDFAVVSDIQVPGLQFDAGKTITPEGERIFQPQAFLTVANEAGEPRYTRNGKFSVTEQGALVTAEGFRVLGENGEPIVLLDPATQIPITNITVNRYGQLLDSTNGQALLDGAGIPIRMLISRVDNPIRLVPEGSNLFRLDAADEGAVTQVTAADAVEVKQGFVESSNVDPTQAVVDMMSASRMYEANQKVIQAYDKSMEKAVNEIGRV
ncbi:flagellar hook-basal body protein [Paenibacillus ginsengarvi]|uniref:Flagellar hook-basal body protein n=1 Tax=Paenibacillus ginsengarvi TaxID=400777 RepID=A0A3B0BYY6_9BACL|nr:flagellar hook-basal body protein [Paenibacillus ginsengarvi]RKN78853.1 flagellar hook-basal body protein [Paenibacillus ginsengarvi]